MSFHRHARAPTSRRLLWSIFLTSAFVVAELAAGCFANSIALLSDAGHNFADVLALAISWYGLRLTHRPPDSRRTFGYHRAGVLAALVNAVSLVVIGLVILWEATQRLRAPPPVQSGPMIVVAVVAVALNGLIGAWLHGAARHDLNIRTAYLHMRGDALAALGVVAAGVVVAVTGLVIADPLVSLLIGGFILWTSWDVLAEAVNVLLEAAPRHLHMEALVRALRAVPGVLDVHDLHVWTVAPGISACSCHVLVAEQTVRDGQQVLRAVASMLHRDFGVAHTTVQVEVEGCDPNDLYCTLPRGDQSHAGHDHG
jgi:cobalt-zinc-cadmium efflux system protein